ncbi:hypothetical protein F4778DRAFT_759088 [Xylariomycetidae sp. FL2044]|nr:hypothetical protein F4778DRAFT_759088 [Xylariomycetidae sp. FL2044]
MSLYLTAMAFGGLLVYLLIYLLIGGGNSQPVQVMIPQMPLPQNPTLNNPVARDPVAPAMEAEGVPKIPENNDSEMQVRGIGMEVNMEHCKKCKVTLVDAEGKIVVLETQ